MFCALNHTSVSFLQFLAQCQKYVNLKPRLHLQTPLHLLVFLILPGELQTLVSVYRLLLGGQAKPYRCPLTKESGGKRYL